MRSAIMRTVTSGVQATTFAHPPHFSDVIRFPVSEASEPVLREGITSRLQTQVTGEVYVRSWLCGCLRLVSKPIAPTWDLALILNFKISLHMTLVMAKHVGDLQVLSVQTFCTQFTRATKVNVESKCDLLPESHGYVLQVLSFEPFPFSPPIPSEEEQEFKCPV